MSPEAIDYLQKMLAKEVVEQVREGRGDEAMSPAWTELHTITLRPIAAAHIAADLDERHGSYWVDSEGRKHCLVCAHVSQPSEPSPKGV